jgi:hypothetical protein
MQINFGAYKIRAHELDQKLTVQVTSDLGEVHIKETGTREFDFPNGVCHFVENPTADIEPKGLRKYAFGEYTFILGINNAGELFLFHSVKLRVGKKLINGIDTINLAFLKDPTA